jgi:hypothetical protein
MAAQQPELAPTSLPLPIRNIHQELAALLPPPVPERVVVPGGTVIDVVLETPLSTRIAKPGMKVTFRTTGPLRLQEQLELPPETGVTGPVSEAKKPGGFGRAGVIRVMIDRIEIPSQAPTPMLGKLQSADADKRGRITTDNTRGTDLIELAQYTLMGTLLGARIHGGKGAGVGAGAGALVALIIMASRRGPDVYLEPGMPFVVVLDKDVELPGAEVYAAQTNYAKAHAATQASMTQTSEDDDQKGSPDLTIPANERPKLKRRPKTPQ